MGKRSITDAVHVNDGFAMGENDEEGPIHCHGLAWGMDENEPDFRYRGNNLFYVSMSDHLHDRGYTRAVQGSPMCACVENMPLVTRSDCTEIKQQNYSRSHYLMKTSRQLSHILKLTLMPAQPRQIMTSKVSMSAFLMRVV